MQTDKQAGHQAETKETRKQFLLARKTCPVCGSPTRNRICQCCVEELDELDSVVVNKFIHTLAARTNKQQPKLRREEEWLDTIEIETDILAAEH